MVEVTGTCTSPWSSMGRDGAGGDFPHLQRKGRCRGNPVCGCCYRAACCPAAGARKAERAAEANGDGPLAVQCRGSSGNAGPPDLLTSDFPSCSSLAPKDRRHGTDTLCSPNTHVCVCMCVFVRTPPCSTGWERACPSQTPQLRGLHWTWGSPPSPPHPSFRSGLSQDKALLGLSSLLARPESGELEDAHSRVGHCPTAPVAVMPPRTPQPPCLLARGGGTEVP